MSLSIKQNYNYNHPNTLVINLINGGGGGGLKRKSSDNINIIFDLMTKILPAEIKNSILIYSDILGINTMSSVNKIWNSFINKNNYLWNTCSLQLNLQNSNKGEIIDFTLLTIELTVKKFPNEIINRSFNNELSTLTNQLGFNNLNELQKISKARDVIVVWKILQEKLEDNVINPINLNLNEINSAKELLEKAEGFQEWFIENLTNLMLLDEIDFSNNQLTILPEELFLLTNLRFLDLSDNELSTISNNIQSLHNLRFLNLKNNFINSLPEGIWELKNLQELNLSGNELTQINSKIIGLSKLEELNISNNYLINLPKEMWDLPHLCDINFSGNNIKELPQKQVRIISTRRLFGFYF